MNHGTQWFYFECLCIVARAEDHPDVAFIPFSQEDLVLIVSSDHRLAKKKVISIKELIDEPIIMKETGSGTRRLVNELFKKSGLIPNILMETSNTEFIKQLVYRGDGISFVVREAVALELREKKLVSVPLEGDAIFLDVSIAYLKDQYMSRPAQAFLDILGKLAQEDFSQQGIGALMAKMLGKRK